MPWGAAAAAAATIGSSIISSNAAQSAAQTQASAADAAAQVQQNMFNTTQANLAPYMTAGTNALAALQQGLGLAPIPQPGVSGQITQTPATWTNPQTGATYQFVNGQWTDLAAGLGNPGNPAPAGTVPSNISTASASVQQGQQYTNPNTGATYKFQNGQWTDLAGNPAPAGTVPPNALTGGPMSPFGPSAGAAPGAAAPATGTSATAGGPNAPLLRQFSAADFTSSPGYQFQLQQGLDAITNRSTTQGGPLSGNALKALMTYGTGLASQDWWNAYNAFTGNQNRAFNELSSLSGSGQNAAANLGSLGGQAAGQIGGSLVGAGNALAAGQVGSANAITGGINNLANLAYLYGPSSTGGSTYGWGNFPILTGTATDPNSLVNFGGQY